MLTIFSFWFAVIISVLLSVYYVLYIYRIKSNWSALPDFSTIKEKDELNDSKLKLAVIVAARNEEDQIGACIKSILNNSYPYFELIVVNDHSEDNTAGVINSFNDDRLKQLNQKTGRSGKKSALEYGVTSTDASLIATIDADCIVEQNYIETLVDNYLTTGFNALAGPIKIKDESGVISSYQQLDVSGTMAVNAYGIETGKYYLSNGANFAFTKDSFIAVDGYRGNDHLASGDDLFLIQKIAQLPSSKIVFLKSPTAIVETLGQRSMRDLLRQRKRWASKSGAYKDHGLKFLLASIFLFHFFILLNCCLGFILDSRLFFISVLMFLIKLLVDYVFLRSLAGYFKTERALRHYVFSSLISTGIIIYSGVIGIFPSSYIWKGRKLK